MIRKIKENIDEMTSKVKSLSSDYNNLKKAHQNTQKELLDYQLTCIGNKRRIEDLEWNNEE